jgi:hypothetical protein
MDLPIGYRYQGNIFSGEKRSERSSSRRSR